MRRRIPRCLCASAALLWLGLGIHFCRRLRVPKCLPLPPQWQNATAALAEPSFVLLWTTDASSFTLRARRCLESICFHHPHAGVVVYSNELPLGFFRAFRKRGFDVRIKRYNVTRLLSDTPAAPWLERLPEWRRGPYYYSHSTDAIRLALLFRLGGVYMDTDVLLTRPVQLASASGAANSNGPRSDDRAAAPRPLRDALGIEAYADPRTKQLTLNGAVMAFGRGSRFLWNALHEFAADYKADRWGWNGPELLTRVAERCATVQIEPPESFYPLHWEAIARYADGQHPASDTEEMWATITRRSYTVHVWNRKTADLTFENGSLLHRLHNSWLVLPGREECT